MPPTQDDPAQDNQPATSPQQPTGPEPDADGYYGDAEPDDELDLSFLDDEKQDDPVQDTPKAP